MRKNSILIALTIIGAILLFSISASALPIKIGFEPESQMPGVGELVDVAVTISGLGDHHPRSLSTFDLNIEFDDSILGFVSVAFGDPVLGDQLDLFGLGSITGFVDMGEDGINIFQLSGDDSEDIDEMQASAFTLATLRFNTLAVGTSVLNANINELGDSLGKTLSAEVRPASISPVPEPATILLLGAGLVGFAGFGRRSIKKSKILKNRKK